MARASKTGWATAVDPPLDAAGNGGGGVLRPAGLSDVDSMVEIENAAFRTDRFSRRTFRHLVTKANAATLVALSPGGHAVGYTTVLFRRDASHARLYSIAVKAAARGRGLGSALLAAAEEAAQRRGAARMRLEVRADDPATQAFYRQHGYRRLGVASGYYEDGVDAIRMEKTLSENAR